MQLTLVYSYSGLAYMFHLFVYGSLGLIVGDEPALWFVLTDELGPAWYALLDVLTTFPVQVGLLSGLD